MGVLLCRREVVKADVGVGVRVGIRGMSGAGCVQGEKKRAMARWGIRGRGGGEGGLRVRCVGKRRQKCERLGR